MATRRTNGESNWPIKIICSPLETALHAASTIYTRSGKQYIGVAHRYLPITWFEPSPVRRSANPPGGASREVCDRSATAIAKILELYRQHALDIAGRTLNPLTPVGVGRR